MAAAASSAPVEPAVVKRVMPGLTATVVIGTTVGDTPPWNTPPRPVWAMFAPRDAGASGAEANRDRWTMRPKRTADCHKEIVCPSRRGGGGREQTP